MAGAHEPARRPAHDPRRTRDSVDVTDRVAEALGGALLRDPENPAAEDARYLDWVADELSADARRLDRRVADDEFLARGRALHAAVLARRAGVLRVPGGPPLRAPAVRGTPGAVLAAALAARATPLVDLAVAAGAGRDLWDEACERWVELPDDVPSGGGRFLALRVRGDSMVPLMHGGDTVLVRLDGAPQAGAIVVARHPEDGYVCKRVRRLDADAIELDSLAPDGPSFTLPGDARLVLGTVVMVWHAGR